MGFDIASELGENSNKSLLPHYSAKERRENVVLFFIVQYLCCHVGAWSTRFAKEIPLTIAWCVLSWHMRLAHFSGEADFNLITKVVTESIYHTTVFRDQCSMV